MVQGFYGDFSDLNEVVERSETFWVFALVHVDERADFGGRETDVIFSEDDLQIFLALRRLFVLLFLPQVLVVQLCLVAATSGRLLSRFLSLR